MKIILFKSDRDSFEGVKLGKQIRITGGCPQQNINC
jgi:hypothetical protein